MARFKDLQAEVDRLNAKYCKHTRNYLEVDRAYNGYSVILTGKRDKRTGKILKGAMQGASDIGNQYHDTATNTLAGLYKAEARGWLKESIKYHEPQRKNPVK